MKRFFSAMILVVLNVACMCADEISADLPKYSNQITAVNEIQGHKNYTIHVTLEENNPVVVYAPESFQESQDKKIHRFVLPNTQIVCDSDCQCLSKDLNNTELILHGTMLLNVIGQNFILMTVAQE